MPVFFLTSTIKYWLLLIMSSNRIWFLISSLSFGVIFSRTGNGSIGGYSSVGSRERDARSAKVKPIGGIDDPPGNPPRPPPRPPRKPPLPPPRDIANYNRLGFGSRYCPQQRVKFSEQVECRRKRTEAKLRFAKVTLRGVTRGDSAHCLSPPQWLQRRVLWMP